MLCLKKKKKEGGYRKTEDKRDRGREQGEAGREGSRETAGERQEEEKHFVCSDAISLEKQDQASSVPRKGHS